MCQMTTPAGNLPATKTHAHRWYSILLASNPELPGTFEVTIGQSKKDVETYGMDYDAAEVLFRKDSADEVYGVERHPRTGRPLKCNCKGFAFKKTCKHFDVVESLNDMSLLG